MTPRRFVILVDEWPERVYSPDGVSYLDAATALAACEEVRADGTEAFVYMVDEPTRGERWRAFC